MNETLKVKSSSTLRSRCRRNPMRSARLRIIPSEPAASSVAHTSSSYRWAPFAAAPASSRRRRPETVPAQPRSARRKRQRVRRPAATSRQLPTVHVEEIGQFIRSRRQRLMTASEADPVRRTSRGQRDTVPSVTPVDSRSRARDSVTDIAPANSTHRSVSGRLETARAVPARERPGSMSRPTTSQHSMGPRESNVDLPELRYPQFTRIRFSAPHLRNIRDSDLYELLDCSMAILEFHRLQAPSPMLGPIRLPTALFERLVTASRNVNYFGVMDAPSSMTEEEICPLPVRKVPNSAIPSHPCTICLKDYERGDLLRVMPCHHEFHQTCLDQWLAIKRNCPVCRNEL